MDVTTITTCPRCRRTTERSSLHPTLKRSRDEIVCSDCYTPVELLATHHAQVVSRERRLESWAHEQGLYLRRSRRRADYGTYGLYSIRTGAPVSGDFEWMDVELRDGYGLDL